MIKPKHIPIRTCVACRTADAKRGLLRVVRQPDGTVAYDSKGKMPGRGAYVCAQSACIALARKQKKFERSLKSSPIPESLYQELELQALRLGRDAALPGTPSPLGNHAAAHGDSPALQAAGSVLLETKEPALKNVNKEERGESCGLGPQESEE